MPPRGHARRSSTAHDGSDDDEAARLVKLQRRREAIAARVEALRRRVYDLESVYLRHYVELGGCLFDGFGLERQQQWAAATAAAAPGSRAAAYRARLHAFSPSDRVFTASSIGALGVVERLKTLEAAGERTTMGRKKRARNDS